MLTPDMADILTEYMCDDLDPRSSLSDLNTWYYTWVNLLEDLTSFLLADDLHAVRSALTNFLKSIRYTTKSILTENCINYPNVLKVCHKINITEFNF